jgi:hypothetical protein
MDERADVELRLADLRARKEELESSIPAHSTKPHHIMRIEDLEEEIGLLEARLRELE